MFLASIAYYLPERIIKNDFFGPVSGISEEWIVERTGIRERRRASSQENTLTMGIEAVKNLSLDVSDVDLIVGATYTPHDTVVTLAHGIQHEFNIAEIPTLSVSSACSSFINAAEIVEGYFALGKASKALVVASEHNSAYSHDEEPKSGPLWGDGAAAVVFTREKVVENSLDVIDIRSAGAATSGKALEGVCLNPKEGLIMPNGRDVFINACAKMSSITEEILIKNNLQLSDLSYLAPHQANYRITKKIIEQLGAF